MEDRALARPSVSQTRNASVFGGDKNSAGHGATRVLSIGWHSHRYLSESEMPWLMIVLAWLRARLQPGTISTSRASLPAESPCAGRSPLEQTGAGGGLLRWVVACFGLLLRSLGWRVCVAGGRGPATGRSGVPSWGLVYGRHERCHPASAPPHLGGTASPRWSELGPPAADRTERRPAVAPGRRSSLALLPPASGTSRVEPMSPAKRRRPLLARA
jgi:hypothetical protein